jgi:hypothetical protein
MHDRLEKLRRINDYSYYLEILEGLPYTEVTEIFVRVNSRGRTLRNTDLALATLSARWPGTVTRVDEQVERCAAVGYADLDATFHTRCLAAFVSDSASPKDFATATIEALGLGWSRVQKGVEHLIKLLQGHLLADTSGLIPSVNALVPVVAFLGLRDDEALDDNTRDALLYWLFGAWIQARFSGSAQTVMSQDVAAVKSEDPIRKLFANLGLLGHRLEVTPSMLAGRGSTSPYFFLSYLCARNRKATDWWFGVPVSALHDGSYKVEYHHIHPRATLRDDYSKSEINDLANLAFISAKANRKITNRSPAAYFPELSEADLRNHLIPADGHLRTSESYPAFAGERRRLLAADMTALLERYRPSFLDEEPAASLGSAGQLDITAFGDGAAATLVITAAVDDTRWSATLPVAALEQVLVDMSDGRASALEIGGETASLGVGAEELQIPLGPLVAIGTLEEWCKVMDRELSDARPSDDLPDLAPPPPWHGDRLPFPVLDSD